jgi:alpha-tubulin suppressor-like RCC1 family protein
LVSLPRSTLLILATWHTGCEPITMSDPGPPGSAQAISAGGAHACGLQKNGNLKCWGKGGLVGDDTRVPRRTAVDVGGFSADVVSVVTGDRHSCALTGDGRVFCWGSNADRGQLGPAKDGGPETDALKPREIPYLVAGGVTFIAAGALHTCVIQPLGEVWCWGDNTAWQVSAGAPAMSPKPTPVLDDAGYSVNGARAVAAGGAHTCFLTGNEARCWGSNDHGQLASRTSELLIRNPFTISLDGGVTAIAAGRAHTCALVGDSVWCWGANGSGQLGDNTDFDSPGPVSPRLPQGTRVVSLSAGGDDTCVITLDRVLWCWGDNTFGQIGDGSKLQQFEPVKVHDLTDDIRNVSVGSNFTCAVTSAGKAYCWGRNADGQLGDGTIEDRDQPREVLGL